jgi:hypothetical protein
MVGGLWMQVKGEVWVYIAKKLALLLDLGAAIA